MIRVETEALSARISVASGVDAAAAHASAALSSALRDGIADKGVAVLAVSGDSSLTPVFTRLAGADLDWSRVLITLVDERWVDSAAADSHERLIRTHLLQGAARSARFVPMKTSAITPLAGIGRQVQSYWSLPGPIDAVCLGLGQDGRFGALSPHYWGLRIGLDLDSPCSCVAVSPDVESPRSSSFMSLTLAAITKARRVVLFSEGRAGLQILKRAVGTICNPFDLPVAALLGARPDCLVLHALS